MENQPDQSGQARTSRDYPVEDAAVKRDRNAMDTQQVSAVRARIKKMGTIKPKSEPLPADFAEQTDYNDQTLINQGKTEKRWRKLKESLTSFFKRNTKDIPE
jgi:hypothetical protein